MTRRCPPARRAAITAALAAAFLAGGAQGCAASSPRPAGLPPSERGRLSDGGGFYVVYSPTPDPVPLNQLFRLELTVSEGVDRSQSAADAEVLVRGWMPEHEHGMNLVPEVHPLGGGRFSVEGMLFHMPGRWQLIVEVRRHGAAEQATFEIQLE
jgi:YtkA-like protein